MSIPSEARSLLTRAADLRAGGANWPDAAKQFAVDEAELRTLATEHQRAYDKFARRARTDAARETFAAALAALRKLMVSDEPRVSLLAATTVVRYEMARMRHSDRASRGATGAASRNTVAFEPHLAPDELAVHDRERNVSELVEVNTCSDFVAAKNVAQIDPAPPTKRPQNATGALAQKQRSLLTAPVVDQFLPAATVRNGPRGAGEPPDLRSWLANP